MRGFATTRIRQRGAARLVAALALLVAAPAWGAAEAPVEAVERVGFTVADMDRSVAFFRDVLDFESVSDREVAGEAYERLMGVFGVRARVVEMRLGDEVLELTEYLTSGGRPIPPDARSNDRSFQHVAIIVRDMDAAYARLRAHKVRHASSGPQRLPDWNPNAGGIEAFYFRDPDGHVLEVLAFPEGKGAARWHQPTERLFLGIDHTAIVVSNTDRSLALYRDVLGLQVLGSSENYGTEQEHLNNLFGARLRVTTLGAARGPAIEFLEYLAPEGGRPMPADSRANDLWHWHVDLRVRDAAEAAAAVRAKDAAWISPGAVDVSGLAPLGRRGALVADPDGHHLRIVEP